MLQHRELEVNIVRTLERTRRERLQESRMLLGMCDQPDLVASHKRCVKPLRICAVDFLLGHIRGRSKHVKTRTGDVCARLNCTSRAENCDRPLLCCRGCGANETT